MGARRVVSPGLLLIVPAGLVWALTVVWPTARLVLVSFDRPTRGDEPGAAVPDNYSAAFAGGFVTGMLDALSVAALPLAVFVVAGLLLGWTGRRGGRAGIHLAGADSPLEGLACPQPAGAAAGNQDLSGCGGLRSGRRVRP